MSPQNDVARKMVEMIRNNSNFKRSGAPARFMFYRNSLWINFPNEIDLLTENQRSIAWIDENGKCFFPKVFVDEEFAKSKENPENPKIEIEIRIDIDGNSSKRKRDEFESNSNSNSNEDEAEVTSSKKPDEDDTSKRLRLTPEFGVESVGQRRDFG
ncbi:probable inactive poly [ADP-ribose] polymerase SRO3 [Fagus crenata]